jgi:hypothetical protein
VGRNEREREKEGMEAERRCSAAARRDGNGFPLELGSNARRYFRLRLSEASRKPTGLLFLTVTFSPGTRQMRKFSQPFLLGLVAGGGPRRLLRLSRYDADVVGVF